MGIRSGAEPYSAKDALASLDATVALLLVRLSEMEATDPAAPGRGSPVEIGNLLPNNRRQRRTCYALCHILYPVSAAHTSIFRMDSNSTSYQYR